LKVLFYVMCLAEFLEKFNHAETVITPVRGARDLFQIVRSADLVAVRATVAASTVWVTRQRRILASLTGRRIDVAAALHGNAVRI